MKGRKGGITLVGERTRGAFSDMLPRTLPNGWMFALPNEQYLDMDGNNYDFTGFKPDHKVAVFTDTDLAAGRDSALEKAIELLAHEK